jgi:hypothetical protein
MWLYILSKVTHQLLNEEFIKIIRIICVKLFACNLSNSNNKSTNILWEQREIFPLIEESDIKFVAYSLQTVDSLEEWFLLGCYAVWLL